MRSFVFGFFAAISCLLGVVGYLWVADELWVHEPYSTGPEECPFEREDVLARQQLIETQYWRVLTNYRQLIPGHCMLIPKRHVVQAHQLTSQEMEDFRTALIKTHELISSRLGTTAYRLLQKNGREVGQSVYHVHFHYMPRKSGSNPMTFTFLENVYGAMPQLSDKEQLELKARLLQPIQPNRGPDL